MTNWNIENSECLKDCENIDNNLLENEDKPFETIVKDEINTENFRDRRRGRARRIGDTQYMEDQDIEVDSFHLYIEIRLL